MYVILGDGADRQEV